MDEMERPRCR